MRLTDSFYEHESTHIYLWWMPELRDFYALKAVWRFAWAKMYPQHQPLMWKPKGN